MILQGFSNKVVQHTCDGSNFKMVELFNNDE